MIEETLYYTKYDNKKLFNSFKKIKCYNLQNYIPLYKKYFSLSKQNWNNINLNHKYHIKNIHSITSDTTINCSIHNSDDLKEVFLKYSPLIDPTKLLMGKYKKQPDLYKLPSFDDNTVPIYDDMNNVAYIDSFFTYLSSKLKDTYNFIHSIQFYGSFLGIKHNFQYDIIDDLEFLQQSSYFASNLDKFKINHSYLLELLNHDTRKNKYNLSISDNETEIHSIHYLNDEFNLKQQNAENQETKDISMIYQYDLTKKTTTSSSNSTNYNSHCSSRISLSDQSHNSNISSETSSEEDESIDDQELFVSIDKMPVQIIAMEQMTDTLDKYIIEKHEMISEREWLSILFQVVINLLVYQEMFNFTHNDLHTNNIMYVETDIKYLYYKYDNTYWKIPTYGKIYKIIDFGRSIYTYKGVKHVSSSFEHRNDAGGQYNIEPYYDPNKPLIDINYSFDLCRLGCALYDFFKDDITVCLNKQKQPPLFLQMIMSWVLDDKGKNILYKSNGKERYPGFKLYKMITRLVHNHTPQNQFKQGYFNQFKISKRNIHKSKYSRIQNIDKMLK